MTPESEVRLQIATQLLVAMIVGNQNPLHPERRLRSALKLADELIAAVMVDGSPLKPKVGRPVLSDRHTAEMSVTR